MKGIAKRLERLENKYIESDEDKLQNRLEKFFNKINAIPNVDEFIESIKNIDTLEALNSKWAKEILAKGLREEFIEILEMTQILGHGSE